MSTSLTLPKTIILEGPDGAGKSELVRKLKILLKNDFKIIHNGPFPGRQRIADIFGNALIRNKKNHLLMDRCWLSEPIYADVKSRRNRITIAEKRMLERLALSQQTVMILCLPPYDVCEKIFKDRQKDEYLKSTTELRMVYNNYFSIVRSNNYHPIKSTCLPLYHYNWIQKDAFQNLCENLSDWAMRCPTNAGPGIGTWNPGKSILLIGEKANSKEDFPFVDIFEPKGGCSGFLAEQLDSINLQENSLYWFNAYDNKTGKSKPSNFISELKPVKIIALGKAATKWCEKSKLKFNSVPHPQHHKRFNLKQKYELLEALRDVV